MAKTSWTPRRGLLRITLGSGPLTRASDRLQALARVVVLLALLAAVPVAATVATATYSNGIAAADAEADSRHQVRARLLVDAAVRDIPPRSLQRPRSRPSRGPVMPAQSMNNDLVHG
jgi:hypothetical protein